MTQLHHQVSLRPYNSFGVEAGAAAWIEISTESQLDDLPKGQEYLILGGGSNLLFTGDVEAWVLKNNIKGREIVAQDERSALIAAGGGENWHELVQWTLEQQLGGLENLSLIPGTVGAAPIQNIGAYGVELQEVFEKLEAIELASGRRRVFDRKDCRFGYRDSIFKQELRGRYFISRVYFRLSRAPHHQLNLSYGAIRETLASMGVSEPDIHSVSRAVVHIRQSKLPDPTRLGNAGSFFKNPLVAKAQFERLHLEFPDIVYYPAGEDWVKIPAGWLIERCGWKGRREGAVGCYEHQALVLVNYGGASGQEILAFAHRIIHSVEERFGIRLEPEVNIIRQA